MKAITLWQPYASGVAVGLKSIETRSWSTSYRGELLITAAKRRPDAGLVLGGWTVSDDRDLMYHRTEECWLDLGVVVAVATLTDVVPIGGDSKWVGIHEFPHEGDLPHQQGGLWLTGACSWDAPRRIEHERPWGDYTPGRYGWLLTDVRPLADPVPCPGGCCKDPAKHFHQGLWTPPAALVDTVTTQTQEQHQ